MNKPLAGVAAVTAAQLAAKDLNDYLTIVLNGAAEASWGCLGDPPSPEQLVYARDMLDSVGTAARRAALVTHALQQFLGAASAAVWPKSS